MVLRIFKIALPLRDWHVLMLQSVKVLNVSNRLTLIQIFYKTKIFFKETGVRLLVKTTKTENTSFPSTTSL